MRRADTDYGFDPDMVKVEMSDGGPQHTQLRMRKTTVTLSTIELMWLSRAAALGFEAMRQSVLKDGDAAASLNTAFHKERAELWAAANREFTSLPDDARAHEFEARLAI